MDIASLAKISGLPIRTLRYVLEHHVLPNSERASKGRRVTRSFSGFECFGIAIAAALIEGGQRRSVVAECLLVLCAEAKPITRSVNCHLNKAYGATGKTRLELGDGVNVRIEAVEGYAPFDTGWIQAATGVKVDKAYDPFVRLSINVGPMRQAIRKAAER